VCEGCHRWGSGYRTYSLRSSTILAALFDAILLLVAVGAIIWEAIRRFGAPITVAGQTMICIAAVGIFINAATALLFLSGFKRDLNIRAAFIHMCGDAAVSFGVVMAGVAIVASGQLARSSSKRLIRPTTLQFETPNHHWNLAPEENV